MSYTLFSLVNRVARKQHKCIWCGQAIVPGTRYDDERSVYDGNIQRHRWHHPCAGAAAKYFRDEGEEEFSAWDNERAPDPVYAPAPI